PRLDLGEAGITAVVPLHGGAAAVAAHIDTGQVLLERIPDTVRRYRHLRHADLVAEIDRGRSAPGEQGHGRDPRLLASNAAGDARPIVIAQHPRATRPRGAPPRIPGSICRSCRRAMAR